jgi:hypothetical protein
VIVATTRPHTLSSWPGKSAKRVFALDDPAIHVLTQRKTWMPGTSPGMTKKFESPERVKQHGF